MPSAGFEPAITEDERPRTHALALHRAGTRIGIIIIVIIIFIIIIIIT